MTITQLSCFLCLVEEKSVTKAARRLHVTQPAVSQQLHLLAENLGCRLFHRRGNRIELTPDGEYVYQKAKGILAELDGLRDELHSRGQRVVGKVRIGCGQVAAKTVLADAVHEMSRQYPEVLFSVFETHSGDLPELIQKSQIDLGIDILPQDGTHFQLEKLFTGRLLLICSKRNKLSARKTISRSELRKLNLIRHSQYNLVRQIPFNLYGEKQIGSAFHLEAMTMETIVSYVRKDMGVALASNYTLEWLKAPGIVSVELEDRTEIPWGVMSDAGRPLSKAAKLFIDKLRQRFTPD